MGSRSIESCGYSYERYDSCTTKRKSTLSGRARLSYAKGGRWPKQPEPKAGLADLQPDTLQGVKIDKRETKLMKATVCLASLQPATDEYYEPLLPYLAKFNSWKKLANVIAACKRWRIKKRVKINPVEIWDTEMSMVALSQVQSYRLALVQLKLHIKVNHNHSLAHLSPFIDKVGHIRL
jgi:hypothetical protein